MTKIILTLVLVVSMVLPSMGQVGDSRSDMDMVFKNLSSINHKGRNIKYSEGSPYYNDNWVKGNMILPSGLKFDDILLKLDLLYNEVHYRSPQTKGDVIVSSGAIKEIQLTEPGTSDGYKTFKIGYPAAYGNDSTTFYSVLVEGNATLLKLYRKSVDEGNAFDTIRKIKLEEIYFLFADDRLIKINNSDSFAKCFPTHKNEISRFIKEKKLNIKDEANLVEITMYCNNF